MENCQLIHVPWVQGAPGGETPCGAGGAFCTFQSLSYEPDNLKSKGRLEISQWFRALVTFEPQHPQSGSELTLDPRLQAFLGKTCTCVYACAHAHTCICVVFVHMHTRVCKCAHVCASAHRCAFVCMCTHVCKCVCAFLCACTVCACMCVYTSSHSVWVWWYMLLRPATLCLAPFFFWCGRKHSISRRGTGGTSFTLWHKVERAW